MELMIDVRSPHGLHARPAAAFVQAAASYRAAVEITNLSAGRGPVPARSILAVLALGVRQGDRVLLCAEGEDSEQALAALGQLLGSA